MSFALARASHGREAEWDHKVNCTLLYAGRKLEGSQSVFQSAIVLGCGSGLLTSLQMWSLVGSHGSLWSSCTTMGERWQPKALALGTPFFF